MTIYIDLNKYSAEAQKILFIIILAHEICHFAYYYELFLNLGDNAGVISHSNFTHAISGTFMGSVIQELDKTSQTVFDEHNITDLLSNFRKFPKSHFSKGQKTNIDYQKLLDDFLNHLNFDKLLGH
jgi:hypothetical protein